MRSKESVKASSRKSSVETKNIVEYKALKPTEVSIDFGNLDKMRDFPTNSVGSKDDRSSGYGRKSPKNQLGDTGPIRV